MRYVIGVDEVGRGSLAGPVVVAAVCVPWGIRIQNRRLGKLKDSKKLSPEKRSEWQKILRQNEKIKCVLARIYPRNIENLNISQAANLAAYNAVRRIIKNSKLKIENCSVFLDGGLYPRSHKISLVSQTVVKGDEKISAIKMASIFAKVQRDKFMVKIAKKYPHYGFEEHKGYATKRHRKALRKFGPSDVHRATFLTKLV